MPRNVFAFIAAGILAGCCGTTVVLVPDGKGKVGQVDVVTQGGKTVLTQANESTHAVKSGSAPSTAEHLSDNEIRDMFASTLAKEPIYPDHYIFYFASGSAEMMPEGGAELDKAKAAIVKRKSCDLSVIGHSDRVGDNSTNEGLSIKRAETVATALTGAGISKDCMDIRYYGENDPAVPTADNVDEPKNRRVEVEIR